MVFVSREFVAGCAAEICVKLALAADSSTIAPGGMGGGN